VEGIRPWDGKSYCYMIEQLKELLQSPDIEDTDSKARRRLEELMRVFRPLYALKARRCLPCPSQPCWRWTMVAVQSNKASPTHCHSAGLRVCRCA
jgi:hypothetical protein